MQRVALHDPGNEHSVNYMWGTAGVGYNEAKIKAAMPNAPVDSWDMIFDPKVVSKFKDCGVVGARRADRGDRGHARRTSARTRTARIRTTSSSSKTS